ncbi:unnamed protein product [Enterobius vermicularis]|uniref:Uncharacterized protein n=1 Tax=Enterobius vermicularis TaxID=51028 RepID=A0A0N4VRS6_ENTVE|nr:unnamed protein product [Enterobius vermicularis]
MEVQVGFTRVSVNYICNFCCCLHRFAYVHGEGYNGAVQVDRSFQSPQTVPDAIQIAEQGSHEGGCIEGLCNQIRVPYTPRG